MTTDVAVIEEVFAKVALLDRLTPSQRRRLARLATTRSFREGTVIVRQGDTSMALYVLLSGRVRIEKRSEQGSTVEIDQVGRGGFFGEMGLIDDVPRSATVVALESTECALLARWDFQTELREDPYIALALLPVLNQRIRSLQEQLASARSG